VTHSLPKRRTNNRLPPLPRFKKPDSNRSANMRAITSKGMRPEIEIRRLVYRLGYRFRLHKKDLPGKPDLVFASRRKVIFVHGCFWHGHDCTRGHVPRSNADYWRAKISRNRQRDKKTVKDLINSGWGVLVIWECEINENSTLQRRIRSFLTG
jgi:DNA mismatch endonuclease (patch repair protein)